MTARRKSRVTPYIGCLWDDVAFKPTTAEPKFCSKRCRDAHAAAGCIAVRPPDGPRGILTHVVPLIDQTPITELFQLTHGEPPEEPVDEWDAWTLELGMRSVDHYGPRRLSPVSWVHSW